MINYCLKLLLLRIHVVQTFQHKLMATKAFFKIVEHKCQFVQSVIVVMDLNSKLLFLLIFNKSEVFLASMAMRLLGKEVYLLYM